MIFAEHVYPLRIPSAAEYIIIRPTWNSLLSIRFHEQLLVDGDVVTWYVFYYRTLA